MSMALRSKVPATARGCSTRVSLSVAKKYSQNLVNGGPVARTCFFPEKMSHPQFLDNARSPFEKKYDADHGYRRVPAHDMTYYRDVPGASVIGFSFRLPRGVDETLWQTLPAGHDLVTSVEPDRWVQDTLLHPNKGEPGMSHRFAGVRRCFFRDFH
jgi:hypothetical protein